MKSQVMPDQIAIITMKDATPLELVLARVIRDNIKHLHLTLDVQHHQGQVNLIAGTSAFNLTISCLAEKIIIRRGLQKDAKVSLSGSWARSVNPGMPLKIKGRWQHPRFTAFVKQLLIQNQRPWQVAAQEFFECVHDKVDVDLRVKVQPSNETACFEWGSGNEDITITGNSSSLQRLFDKQSILIEEVVLGRIQCHSSLRTTTLLSELTINRLLGEL
jgi:hypothetical protein